MIPNNFSYVTKICFLTELGDKHMVKIVFRICFDLNKQALYFV